MHQSNSEHEQMCEIMQKIDECGSEDSADLLSTGDDDTREVIKWSSREIKGQMVCCVVCDW